MTNNYRNPADGQFGDPRWKPQHNRAIAQGKDGTTLNFKGFYNGQLEGTASKGDRGVGDALERRAETTVPKPVYTRDEYGNTFVVRPEWVERIGNFSKGAIRGNNTIIYHNRLMGHHS